MEQVIGNCFVCIIACYSGESKCSGDLWRRTKKLQDWRTCWCGGWVLGRVANCRGDCWQVPRILWIIGEISAWISRSSVGVVLSAPVTSPPPELRCKMKSIHPRYYVAGPIHSWPPPAATHSDPMSGLFSARPFRSIHAVHPSRTPLILMSWTRRPTTAFGKAPLTWRKRATATFSLLHASFTNIVSARIGLGPDLHPNWNFGNIPLACTAYTL